MEMLLSLQPPPGFRGTFRADDEARAVYAEAAGIARILPLAVAVPRDVEDVSLLVRWARSTETMLVPRASGSSMAGGAIGRGIVVDLSRLNAVGPIDVDRRSVVVEPGAIRDDVNRRAQRFGLRFPVDPSSGAFCTVGGMAATNASGPHSLLYGSTRGWVRALVCVFDDGSCAEVRRGGPLPTHVPAVRRFVDDVAPALVEGERARRSEHLGVLKESSGYALADFANSADLIDLLVGSEGTLALFVGVELSLIPVAAATCSVLGTFLTLEEAVNAAAHARGAGAAACELLDRTFLDVAGSGGHAPIFPGDVEAVLLAEVEGRDPGAAADAGHAIERIFLVARAGSVRVALDPPTEARLWALRHAASPILSRLDPALKSMQFVEDGAVPPGRLAEYVRGVREILARAEVRGVIFGHAGDSHIHVNPLVDVRLHDWRSRVERILDDVTALAASLGGTITGEHGDGRLRTPLLHRVWSEEARRCFSLLKSAFDPVGILNRGVKVPLAEQHALEDIKYDPALPPPPVQARAALDEVERERAYARFRFDLLDHAH